MESKKSTGESKVEDLVVVMFPGEENPAVMVCNLKKKVGSDGGAVEIADRLDEVAKEALGMPGDGPVECVYSGADVDGATRTYAMYSFHEASKLPKNELAAKVYAAFHGQLEGNDFEGALHGPVMVLPVVCGKERLWTFKNSQQFIKLFDGHFLEDCFASESSEGLCDKLLAPVANIPDPLTKDDEEEYEAVRTRQEMEKEPAAAAPSELKEPPKNKRCVAAEPSGLPPFIVECCRGLPLGQAILGVASRLTINLYKTGYGAGDVSACGHRDVLLTLMLAYPDHITSATMLNGITGFLQGFRQLQRGKLPTEVLDDLIAHERAVNTAFPDLRLKDEERWCHFSSIGGHDKYYFSPREKSVEMLKEFGDKCAVAAPSEEPDQAFIVNIRQESGDENYNILLRKSLVPPEVWSWFEQHKSTTKGTIFDEIERLAYEFDVGGLLPVLTAEKLHSFPVIALWINDVLRGSWNYDTVPEGYTPFDHTLFPQEDNYDIPANVTVIGVRTYNGFA
jgi:hypothetical protein